MKFRGVVFALIISPGLVSLSRGEGSASILIDAARPGVKISPSLYGIFFEDINRAVDGGIYAEMVQNRAFEDGASSKAWTLINSGADATCSLVSDEPLNEFSPRSMRLTARNVASDGRAGIANSGFGGMPLKRGTTYVLDFHARCSRGHTGSITATLESADGSKSYATSVVQGVAPRWQRFTCELKCAADERAGRLVLATTTPGSIWFDCVSLFPKENWKGRPDGLRADLAEMLVGLKPAFMRFPGGCYVEGDTLKEAYRWKQTIGDISIRPGRPNLWRYRSSDGIGYHEYLQLCEDIGAAALFVVNCGMSHKQNVPMDQMPEWVQDALDAIEYANGPADSKWGSVRAKAGHPAPFNLKYIEVGNENGGPAYNERYALFYDAIRKKYPEIRIIADLWGGVPTSRPVEIIDEHYYSNPEFFINNAFKYDRYERKGPKIYVGEYAVTQGCGKHGNLRAAVGEAAFMTGMERNSDVVIMASYAPLFVRMDTRSWNPNLINFDNTRVFGTPSYYVQKMFAENVADVVLPMEITADALPLPAKHGAIGLGTWATQAEYRDVKVTSGEKVLAECDFAKGSEGWKPASGQWAVVDGAYRQTGRDTDIRSVFGDVSWSDYTLTLKARKLDGAEGFLIMFHVQDKDNFAWWNIGGWGNSRHAIEVARGGGKSNLGNDVRGRIETGPWYDIRIETKGQTVRCFLDGKLVHQAEYSASRPLYGVAGRGKNEDVIVKVVNVTHDAYATKLRLGGVDLSGTGTATVLTGDRNAENTIEEPTKVAPITSKLEGVKGDFAHTLPPQSVTILRLNLK